MPFPVRSRRVSRVLALSAAPVAALAAAVAVAPHARASEYALLSVSHATVVGPNRFDHASRPENPGVNDWGDFAGRCFARDGGGTIGATRPALFDRRAGTITNLGHPDDAADDGFATSSSIWAYDVNDLGWVCGGSHLSSGVPYVWRDADGNGAHDDGEMLVIDTESARGIVSHVNNAGQILLNDGFGGPVERAQLEVIGGVLVETGVRVRLTDEGTPEGLTESGDCAWSSSGQGYRWMDRDGDDEVDPDEVATLSSPIDGVPAPAIAMNSHGDLLGWFDTPFYSRNHGFVWSDADDNDVQDPGETVIVSTNYYDKSVHCWCLNDHGQVAGAVAGFGVDRWAFVWDAENGLRNLNERFEYTHPELGVYWAKQAYGINNYGEVAVFGFFVDGGSSEYAALITPQPRFDGIARANPGVILPVSGLVAGRSVEVETTGHPGAGPWSPAGVIEPTSCATNWPATSADPRGAWRLSWDEGW